MNTSMSNHILSIKNTLNSENLKKVGQFLGIISKETTMRITKEEIRKIIKEEMEQMQGQQSSTMEDLKQWFLSKKDTVRDLGVPAGQIRALIDYMEDGIQAAQAGKLKTSSSRLGAMMDKLSGKDQAQ